MEKFGCYSFQYGGCGGNQNRFQSEDDCFKFCSGNDPPGSESKLKTKMTFIQMYLKNEFKHVYQKMHTITSILMNRNLENYDRSSVCTYTLIDIRTGANIKLELRSCMHILGIHKTGTDNRHQTSDKQTHRGV